MNPDLGLRVLGDIMQWSNDEARQEYAWLRVMARLKYDGYRDFHAGMRFIESLATWLQQFDLADRQTAYDFVRRSLVYIGPAEIHHLVGQFFPTVVRPHLLRAVTEELGLRYHHALTDPRVQTGYHRALRRTLIMGLSDGARIDAIRHANAGVLSNEQVVHATQIDTPKWKDLLAKLREDQQDSDARFRSVYLVDDFAGTGSSFLRPDDTGKGWTGKLTRFLDSVERAISEMQSDSVFLPDWDLCVHYYIASARAAKHIEERLDAVGREKQASWPRATRVSFGMVLPSDLPIDEDGRCSDFVALTQTYYDPQIRTGHTDVGGVEDLGLGYSRSALPVVLEHNTPNNSVALLWAETKGSSDGESGAPAMRPLFRRRQRHG